MRELVSPSSSGNDTSVNSLMFFPLRVHTYPKSPKFPKDSYDLVMGLRSSVLLAQVCEQKLASTGRLLCGGNWQNNMGE